MFYADIPILSINQDLLNRGSFAKLLAKSLLNLNNKDTFSIGLFGEWGSGKTSLVNMMLSEIESSQTEKDKLIIVHFDPWNFSNEEQLLSQFFIRLSNEFRSKKDNCLSNIGKALQVYSKAFDINNNVISILQKILSLLEKRNLAEKDILKQKEYIISLLEKQSSKILIVIDDIDRLSNLQIRQVFQLITSVAKFPNTIYLLAFDKKIVVKALEKVQEGKGEDYLEKVIQMPIEIPNIRKKELHQVLLNRLNNIVSERNNIHFSEERLQRIFEPCISPFIKNLRDVNRLCNLVRFKVAALENEVDFVDVVSISVAEIFLPAIYDWIKENKSILTGERDFTIIIKNKTPKEWYEYYKSQFNSLLIEDTTIQSENNIIDTAMVFLAYLFPHFGDTVGKIYNDLDLDLLRKNNNIGHPSKFNRYFHLDLNDITLRKSEIIHNVQFANKNELITFMLKQDKKGNSYEFLKEIHAMISDISIERTLCILDSLIESSKYFVSTSAYSYSDLLIIDLVRKLEANDRLQYILNILNSADLNTLMILSKIIKDIESGYGRLSDNEKQRDYYKVITIDELEILEKEYCNKVKYVLKKENLFSIDRWRIVFYLLECLDPNYIKTYLSNSFKEDRNILSFLEGEVAIWSGGDAIYEINENYKKYLDTETILNAISTQLQKGEFFFMTEKIQNCCGAFYLKLNDKCNSDRRICQSDVNKLIDLWENSTNILDYSNSEIE
ncbi:MAG: P-loop NTPase fold protein [Acutalibacteraceae bacterium]